MYFFLLDVVAFPPVGNGTADGYAVIWVDTTRYPDAERAALEFAGTQGLTVRAVESAHRPSQEELERMSLEQLAARARGEQEGVWGYFIPRVNEERPVVAIKTRPLTKRPRSPARR